MFEAVFTKKNALVLCSEHLKQPICPANNECSHSKTNVEVVQCCSDTRILREEGRIDGQVKNMCDFDTGGILSSIRYQFLVDYNLSLHLSQLVLVALTSSTLNHSGGSF